MFSARRSPFIALALILMFAAVLRVWNLADLPAGLHGDEGIVGYEARRILREGAIGPYSTQSFGQPAGPIYFTALAEKIGGESILTIRLVSAFFGVLGVAAMFGLVRRQYGDKAGLLGAFLLAVLPWHLHFSRIAFPLIAWPLCVILAIWTLLEALEKPNGWRFAFAGFWLGLGIYAYKAHPLFLLLGLIFGVVCGWKNSSISLSKNAVFRVVFVAATLLTANFLIRYALDPANDYNAQLKLYSVWNQADYLALSSQTQKIAFLAARYFGWWRGALLGGATDYGDGAGIIPLFSPLLFGLALVGFFSWKKRDALANFSRVVVVVMPLANVVTIEAFARRTMALAPFLCVLAVVGALAIVQIGARPNIGKTLVASAVAAIAFVGVRSYFVNFASDKQQAWIFCDQLSKSVERLKKVPVSRPIYFYSDRWSCTYDTRKFLAPDLRVLDRSEKFGAQNAGFAPLGGDQKPVWILLDAYQNRLGELQRAVPGGNVENGPISIVDGQPAFILYQSP